MTKLTPEAWKTFMKLREENQKQKTEESRKALLDFAIEHGADAGSGTILEDEDMTHKRGADTTNGSETFSG